MPPVRTFGQSRKSSMLSSELAYWIPTGLLAALMLMSGITNSVQTPESLQMIGHLGYPAYFSTMIGVAKTLGALAIVLPVPRVLREWAYAGLTFDVIAATISLSVVDGVSAGSLFPLVVVAFVLLSRRGWLKRVDRQQEARPAAVLGAPAFR